MEFFCFTVTIHLMVFIDFDVVKAAFLFTARPCHDVFQRKLLSKVKGIKNIFHKGSHD